MSMPSASSGGNAVTTSTFNNIENNANISNSNNRSTSSRRAKDLFGDCALVEIIHLHDCFRGALRALEVDVSELCREISSVASEPGDQPHQQLKQTQQPYNASVPFAESKIIDLERRVAGRFTVIWSVFRAHSAAEDEFIWPALKAKQVDFPNHSPGHSPAHPSHSSGIYQRHGSDDSLSFALQQINQQQLHVHPIHQNQHAVIGVQGGGMVGVGAVGAGAAVGAEGPMAGVQQNNNNEQQNENQQRERAQSITVHCIEQEEYEEDHADEERMFNSMNDLLSNLREQLSKNRAGVDSENNGGSPSTTLPNVAQMLLEGMKKLMKHLMDHLEKEETHCMPLVAQYLTKTEINDLVGKIMGKRSSELMSQILTMAVQNLNDADRDDMVRYMKQAMVGTFFERWLKMGGWIEGDDGGGKMPPNNEEEDRKVSSSALAEPTSAALNVGDGGNSLDKAIATNEPSAFADKKSNSATMGEVTNKNSTIKITGENQLQMSDKSVTIAVHPTSGPSYEVQNTSGQGNNDPAETSPEKYTSAAELEKLIRAIGTNPNLDTKQKNLTIQGLRDSVWKSNCRLSKRKREEGDVSCIGQPPAQIPHVSVAASVPHAAPAHASFASRPQPEVAAPAAMGGYPQQTHHMSFSGALASATVGSTRWKRETPPSYYFKTCNEGEPKLVWSSVPHSTAFHPNDGSVPLFSASELAPTYHDGGIHRVLGCPHYARSCKLRHPSSGKLYTCRLCCDQSREMATTDKDSPLDRYEVTEVLCMRCNALQPAGDKCINPACESRGKPFSRYTCKICNFYDDTPNKSIYHCPFCNVCRTGQGLGIDYRHCMRCNACVSLKDEHHCIPQRLQGNCPICHETMFESTEPLRGLKCGHVMHLSCFTMYMRGHSYTCPLCKKSAEDMREYFALLDSAIRMQPMPPAYAVTTSNIYCQDCGKMGNVSYHFVGLKCGHCGSFNTRELQRVDANIMAGLWQN